MQLILPLIIPIKKDITIEAIGSLGTPLTLLTKINGIIFKGVLMHHLKMLKKNQLILKRLLNNYQN